MTMMRSYQRFSAALLFGMFFAVFSGVVLAQGNISTYAGNDALFAGGGLPATSAQLVNPNYIAVDGQGNLYFSASGQAMVLKVSAATGIISVVAGNGLSGYSGDGGLAVGTSLGYPSGLAIDSAGNLYIADSNNTVIRKVAPNGIITTAAGIAGQYGFSGDGGPATQAKISYPTGIATDSSGNLYIMDLGNNRVRKVTASTGIISTIAGNGLIGYTGDGGPAIDAAFNYPEGLAVDSSGNVYVCDQNSAVIREISTTGTIATVAGNGQYGYSGDSGPATKAALLSPTGVAFDASGNMYIADSGNQRIRRVNSSGIITSVAGTGTAGFSGDGAAASAATFNNPIGIALDSSGAIYVADEDNNRVRRFVVGGDVATFAGTATSIGDGGPAPQAVLVSPSSVAIGPGGNLFISDSSANRIRKVTPSGTISTVAGNGQTGGSGNNGPATSAALNTPYGVAVDSAGDLYIADGGNNEIRRVDAITGKIAAFAGPGCCYAGAGTSGDGGPAVDALLLNPRRVAVDPAGNVYFVDQVRINGVSEGVAIRRVTTDGKINIWVGGGPTPGFSGDGGSPLKAQLSGSLATGIATGPDGSLYIADTYNNRVRKVDPTGSTINTIAGNGQATASGDGGPALSAGVPGPESVAMDSVGNLYIGNQTSVRIVLSNGIINTYAGNGQTGFSGDGGPATSASLAAAVGLTTDSGNNLYIADENNRRIRQVQPFASPAIALSYTSLTFSLTATGSTATTQTFVVTNGGQGTLNWAASASATSGGTWLSVSPATGSVLAGASGTMTVTANPSGLAAGDYYGQIQVTSPNATSQIQSLTVRLTVATVGEAPPVVFAGGVINAASYTAPVAPGTFVSIFGSGFTDSTSAIIAPAFPWLNELGGTSVTIGGESLPLYFVTAGQINAILPFDLAVGSSLQVVVTRNSAVSAPQPVNLVSSQPGVFTQAQTGQGIGAILIVHPDGSWVVAGNGNSAKAGDVLEIFCTGLGDVSPRLVAGYPAPPSPLSYVIDAVSLTIGGVSVVPAFAGAAPGFSGLYQVNAVVPAGIAASQQVPIVMSQAGRAGVTVTVPVE
jgi:uncharacterized protein (TIGR03437 family)